MLYCIQRCNLYTNIRGVYLEMQRGQTLLQKGQTPLKLNQKFTQMEDRCYEVRFYWHRQYGWRYYGRNY